MNTQDALRFLERYQPLPPEEKLPVAEFNAYWDVLRVLSDGSEHRAVRLLLNSIGPGDYGCAFQEIAYILRKYPADLVRAELLRAMHNPSEHVRSWCAEYSSDYLDDEVRRTLLSLVARGSTLDRAGALLALSCDPTPASLMLLRDLLNRTDIKDEVRIDVSRRIRDTEDLNRRMNDQKRKRGSAEGDGQDQ